MIDNILYRFEGRNYNNHLLKHSKIGHDKFLKEIEDAISNPDCITEGPKLRQNNFYRTIYYQDIPKARHITYWKVVVFYKNKKFAEIATAFDSTSVNYNVINKLEKVIWTKPNSKI